jgi:hypothetical protein
MSIQILPPATEQGPGNKAFYLLQRSRLKLLPYFFAPRPSNAESNRSKIAVFRALGP